LRQITAAPLAGPSFVCIQSYSGTTLACEAETGKELWRARLGGSLQSTPALTDSTVYLATHPGVLYALQ
jgi:outer membrane protein assembly factor BamB